MNMLLKKARALCWHQWGWYIQTFPLNILVVWYQRSPERRFQSITLHSAIINQQIKSANKVTSQKTPPQLLTTCRPHIVSGMLEQQVLKDYNKRPPFCINSNNNTSLKICYPYQWLVIIPTVSSSVPRNQTIRPRSPAMVRESLCTHNRAVIVVKT